MIRGGMKGMAAGLALLAASPAVAEDGLGWQDGLPRLSAFGGGFTMRPSLRLDADAGSFFGQDEPEGFRSGVNLRRARLGLRGALGQAVEYRFTWDFGGSSPNDYSQVYEAQLAWKALDGMTVRAGAFQLRHLPEYAGSSFETLFLERAAISNIAASVASGDTRTALGLEAHGERWVASAYGTGGVLSTRNDGRQRGLVGRAAWLAFDAPGGALQLGLNGAHQFEPGTSPGRNSIGLDDYPELRVDSRVFLDTGTIPADSASAWGPEAAGRAGPLYVEALYQRVTVDALSGGRRDFSGWYVQAALPLLGPPREREADSGSWGLGTVPDFNPAAGGFGALELAGRYSEADLRDGETRGGRQRIWSVGLNWFPAAWLRLSAQYQNGRIGLDGPDRDFQAIGLRAAFEM